MKTEKKASLQPSLKRFCSSWLYDRSVLALKLKPIIHDKAKEKEIERKTTFQKSVKSSLPNINTTKEISQIAGVSHDTISKVQKIEEQAPVYVKEQVKAGEMSINEGYKIVKVLELKGQPKPEKEPEDEEIMLIQQQQKVQQRFDNAISTVSKLTINTENIDAWLSDLTQDFIDENLERLDKAIENLKLLKLKVTERQKVRLVK